MIKTYRLLKNGTSKKGDVVGIEVVKDGLRDIEARILSDTGYRHKDGTVLIMVQTADLVIPDSIKTIFEFVDVLKKGTLTESGPNWNNPNKPGQDAKIIKRLIDEVSGTTKTATQTEIAGTEDTFNLEGDRAAEFRPKAEDTTGEMDLGDTREDARVTEARAQLKRLEDAGRGDSDQANALRRTISDLAGKERPTQQKAEQEQESEQQESMESAETEYTKERALELIMEHAPIPSHQAQTLGNKKIGSYISKAIASIRDKIKMADRQLDTGVLTKDERDSMVEDLEIDISYLEDAAKAIGVNVPTGQQTQDAEAGAKYAISNESAKQVKEAVAEAVRRFVDEVSSMELTKNMTRAVVGSAKAVRGKIGLIWRMQQAVEMLHSQESEGADASIMLEKLDEMLKEFELAVDDLKEIHDNADPDRFPDAYERRESMIEELDSALDELRSAIEQATEDGQDGAKQSPNQDRMNEDFSKASARLAQLSNRLISEAEDAELQEGDADDIMDRVEEAAKLMRDEISKIGADLVFKGYLPGAVADMLDKATKNAQSYGLDAQKVLQDIRAMKPQEKLIEGKTPSWWIMAINQRLEGYALAYEDREMSAADARYKALKVIENSASLPGMTAEIIQKAVDGISADIFNAKTLADIENGNIIPKARQEGSTEGGDLKSQLSAAMGYDEDFDKNGAKRGTVAQILGDRAYVDMYDWRPMEREAVNKLKAIIQDMIKKGFKKEDITEAIFSIARIQQSSGYLIRKIYDSVIQRNVFKDQPKKEIKPKEKAREKEFDPKTGRYGYGEIDRDLATWIRSKKGADLSKWRSRTTAKDLLKKIVEMKGALADVASVLLESMDAKGLNETFVYVNDSRRFNRSNFTIATGFGFSGPRINLIIPRLGLNPPRQVAGPNVSFEETIIEEVVHALSMRKLSEAFDDKKLAQAITSRNETRDRIVSAKKTYENLKRVIELVNSGVNMDPNLVVLAQAFIKTYEFNLKHHADGGVGIEKDLIGLNYRLSELAEFVTGVVHDKDLQRVLESMPVDDEMRKYLGAAGKLLTRLVEAIRRVWGWSKSNMETYLDAAASASEKFVMRTGGNIGYSSFIAQGKPGRKAPSPVVETTKYEGGEEDTYPLDKQMKVVPGGDGKGGIASASVLRKDLKGTSEESDLSAFLSKLRGQRDAYLTNLLQTSTPERAKQIRKWVKTSKIKRVLFRGQSRAYEEFDPDTASEQSVSSQDGLMHLTFNPEYAATYAGENISEGRTPGAVIAGHVNLRNVIDLGNISPFVTTRNWKQFLDSIVNAVDQAVGDDETWKNGGRDRFISDMRAELTGYFDDPDMTGLPFGKTTLPERIAFWEFLRHDIWERVFGDLQIDGIIYRDTGEGYMSNTRIPKSRLGVRSLVIADPKLFKSTFGSNDVEPESGNMFRSKPERAARAVLLPSGEVANHGDQELANRGFITNEATKMPADLAGVKLVIEQSGNVADNSNNESFGKGKVVLKGKTIAEFEYNDYDGNRKLDFIHVQKKHRGKGLSKVIQAEIIERGKRSIDKTAETYSATVQDRFDRPTAGMVSLLGKENVFDNGPDYAEAERGDAYAFKDPETGEWITKTNEVSANIPNQYTPEQRQLIDDIQMLAQKGDLNDKSLGKALDRWAREVLGKPGTRLMSPTPDVIAAMVWETARAIQKTGIKFAQWSAQTLKDWPKLKNVLKTVWERAKKITENPLDFIRFRALDSIADKVWQNSARNKQSPTLRKIANMVFAKSGPDADAVENDIPTRINLVRNQFANIYAAIMEKFAAEFAEMTKEQRQAWDVELRRHILDGTTPSDPKMAQAVGSFRTLMRSLLNYQKAAGVDMGDAGSNYFPRHYDADSVLNDRDRFVMLAEEMYRRREARVLQENIDKANKYVDAKALELEENDKKEGRKPKTKAEYKQRARDMADREIERLQKEYDEKDDEWYADAADRWATSITHGDVMGLTLGMDGNPSILPQSTLSREFSEDEAAIVDEYMVKDVDRIMMTYIDGAVRNAEVTQSLGKNGELFTQMLNKLSKEGVSKEVIKETQDLVRKALGFGRYKMSSAETAFFDVVNVVLASAYLGKTFVYNLVLEPLSFGVRTGNVYMAVRGMLETWKNTIDELARPGPVMRQRIEQRLGSRQAWERSVEEAVGEHLGLLQREIERSYLNAHWNYDDNDKGSKAAKWLAQRIFRANLLSATERAKITASISIARLVLMNNARFARGQTKMQQLFSGLGLDANADQSVAAILRENGVPEADHQAFIDFVMNLEGKSDTEWRKAVMSSNSPMAKHYRRALQRLSIGMSIKTNPALKTSMADHPVGRLMMTLMNYTYAYANLVKDRMYSMAAAIVSKDASAIDRLRYAAPLMIGGTLSVVGAVASRALIEALWPSEGYDERKKRGAARQVFDAASFAGMFGPKLEYLFKFFNREQSPGGPVVESVSRLGAAAFSAADLPESERRQYSLKKQAYGTVGKPAVIGASSAVHPFFGFFGTQFMNRPEVQKAAIGKKPE